MTRDEKHESPRSQPVRERSREAVSRVQGTRRLEEAELELASGGLDLRVFDWIEPR